MRWSDHKKGSVLLLIWLMAQGVWGTPCAFASGVQHLQTVSEAVTPDMLNIQAGGETENGDGETVRLTIHVAWTEAAAAIRPKGTDITVTGTAGGNEVYRQAEHVDAGQAQKILQGLPRWSAQTPPALIAYRVEAAPLGAYDTAVDMSGMAPAASGAYACTIAHTLKTLSPAGKVVFAGDAAMRAREGFARPAEAAVFLARQSASGVRDEAFSAAVTATGITNDVDVYSVSFGPAAMCDGEGNPYTYAIDTERSGLHGYTPRASADGMTLTHTLDTVDIQVKIHWEDKGHDEAYRPGSVPIRLTGMGTDGRIHVDEIKQVQEPAGDTGVWTVRFEGLMRTDTAGGRVRYVVSETPPVPYACTRVEQPEMDPSGGMLEASLVNALPVQAIRGGIAWQDAENVHHTRPGQVALRLSRSHTQSGTPQTENLGTFTVTEPWQWSVENLPTVHPDGSAYHYSASIAGADPRYDFAQDENAPTNLTAVLLSQDVVISQQFEDAGDRYGRRPAHTAFRLTSSTGLTFTGELTSADGWQRRLVDLPKYDGDGALVSYSLAAGAQTGYRMKTKQPVPEAEADEYDAVLMQTLETVDLTAHSAWLDYAGIKPDVAVHIRDGNKRMDGFVLGAGKWSRTFTGLPRYREDGAKAAYTIDIDALPGYRTHIERHASPENTFVFGLTHVRIPPPYPQRWPQATRAPASAPARPGPSPTAAGVMFMLSPQAILIPATGGVPAAGAAPGMDAPAGEAFKDVQAPTGYDVTRHMGECFY